MSQQFLRIYQHLLPRALAWTTTKTTKRLRQLFEGLSEWPADFRAYIDRVWLDASPEETRELEQWEEQFGLLSAGDELVRRSALRSEWLSNGGQGRDYLQEALQPIEPTAYLYPAWFDLGTELRALRPLLWLKTDDVEAVAAGGAYVSIPNRGTLGGNVTSASGTGPERVEVDGKFAALTTTNGGLRFGDAASFALLHSPDTTATVLVAFRMDALPTVGYCNVLQTRSADGPTLRGLNVRVVPGGVVQVGLGNGSASQFYSAIGVITPGLHVIAIRKSALSYECWTDAVKTTLTATSLVTGNADSPLFLGGYYAGASKLSGALCEAIVMPYAVPDQKMAMIQEVLRRWSGGTGFVPRDPRNYVSQPLTGTIQCGEPLAACGEANAQANAFLANQTHYLVNKDWRHDAPPPVPSDPSTWPYFVYVAGPDGPDDVFFMSDNKRRALERQILKTRPLDCWVAMRDVGAGHIITDENGFISVDENGFLETT